MTEFEWREHERRLSARKVANSSGAMAIAYDEPALRETGKGGLHEQIMDYCDARWPKWVYVHSRTDQPSSVSVGLPDFVIALPNGKTLWLECKAKGGKLTTEQLAWKLKLEMLKQHYACVYSFQEFVETVNQMENYDT